MGNWFSVSLSISPVGEFITCWEWVAGKVKALVPVDGRACEPTVGLEDMLERVWCCLMREEVRILGLYGLGGVGKTTLLTQINNKFLQNLGGFDLVIWVTVSKDLNLVKVQEDIGKRLFLANNDNWKEKDFDGKAVDIYNVLHKRRFVLLLDDIWDQVDLVKVGVPKGQKGSKLIFTTRSDAVCRQMDADERIKMEPLAWEEAWKLFQEKVGKDTLTSHPNIIPSLAEDVARECDGLPIALVTIARAMAGRKTPEEWRYAVEVLRQSASNLQGTIDEFVQDIGIKVFTRLRFSYDSLPSKLIKSCFLYCTLFPEDFEISKNDLIDYWVCESFWNDYHSGLSNHNLHGYNVVGTLVRACLLEDGGEYVKMHDVIRDMGLWIACNSEESGENFFVQAGAQLIEAPELRKLEMVRRMSLMGNSFQAIKGSPACCNLWTLFLSRNPFLHTIGDEFFQFMDVLTVLDLSGTRINELPSGISNLVSLQYLNLSSTELEILPVELKMLVKLKYLNLEKTRFLKRIPAQVLSNFKLLQVLRMLECGCFHSFDNLLSDGNMLVEELQGLTHLNVLTITIKCASALQGLFRTQNLSNSARVLSLLHFEGTKSVNISQVTNMKYLNTLYILANHDLEELEIQAPGNFSRPAILKKSCFASLKEVHVRNCPYLRDLTCLILVPNLMFLSVSECESMEEIISVVKLGKAANYIAEHMNLFGKLEYLVLYLVPQLKSICWTALPFPVLKKINVVDCPMLKRLPLSFNSAKGCKVEIGGKEDWWNGIKWEDDATKSKFLPSFVDFQ